MKKLLSIVVLGAVVLAACGGGGTPAATVDGTDITVGDVESLIATDGSTITKEQFAQFLAFSIQWVVIGDSAEADYGIVITDEQAAEEADRIYEEVGAEGQSREDFLSTRGVTEAFLLSIARQGLIDVEVREILREDVTAPSTEEIETARGDAAVALTNVCASHILVATEQEANDIVTRLDGGEDFGALAVELSTDTGSGANDGALGCTTPDTYVEPFAEAVMAAPVGEVYDQVIQTEFGFHLILVTDREEPVEADLPSEDEIVEGLQDEQILAELEDWFLTSVAAADVTVDEQFGTWQPNPPLVVPPSDPQVVPPSDGATTTSIAG